VDGLGKVVGSIPTASIFGLALFLLSFYYLLKPKICLKGSIMVLMEFFKVVCKSRRAGLAASLIFNLELTLLDSSNPHGPVELF